MARTRLTITNVYQPVATGKCIIEVAKSPKTGELLFNDTAASDVTAKAMHAREIRGEMQQTADVITYMRSDTDGFEVIVDDNV